MSIRKYPYVYQKISTYIAYLLNSCFHNYIWHPYFFWCSKSKNKTYQNIFWRKIQTLLHVKHQKAIYPLITFIDNYSITIVATLPEPTVLPPSRNYFIIVWYILFYFRCFHCVLLLFMLSLFLLAWENDDSLTTLSYYLFPIVNLGYQMYDITMLYYQQAYAKRLASSKALNELHSLFLK